MPVIRRLNTGRKFGNRLEAPMGEVGEIKATDITQNLGVIVVTKTLLNKGDDGRTGPPASPKICEWGYLG